MHTFYSHVCMNVPASHIKYVIGRNGKHLKRCRSHTGVQSVWYNASRNLISIYGPIDRLQNATIFIENQISLVRSAIPLEFLVDVSQTEADTCVALPLAEFLSKDDVKFVIGRKGNIFKQITKEADVSFIWYDAVEHRVRIWGPQSSLPCAIRLIFEQIQRSNLSWVSQNPEEYYWKLQLDSVVCPLTV